MTLLSLRGCVLSDLSPKCRLGFSRVLKGAIDKGMSGGSLKLLRETMAESSPVVLDVDYDDLDLGERILNNATLEELKTKHPFHPAPSLPHLPIDHHHLIASSIMVLDRIKSFPHGTSCGKDDLRVQDLMDCLSRVIVVVYDELVSVITQVVNLFLAGNCPLLLGDLSNLGDFMFKSTEGLKGLGTEPNTLVQQGGGIRPIAVGTFWRRLVSKVSVIMIGHSLDGYLDYLYLGVGVSGGSKAILYFVKRLIESCGDDIGLSMLLVDFKTPLTWLYFTMCTCPPRVFESAKHYFDVALRSSLERIVTASGLGFGDWLIFEDALSVFNISIETELLSNPSEIAAPKLMKKMADKCGVDLT
nr:hypothetical protein [Tanacetum cinerariifolium]